MNKIILMLCVGLATFVASLPASSARTSGKERAASDVDTIVIHSIGGPACRRNSVVFQPIPAREDDADFWKKILLKEPEADAHFVVGRDGKVAEVIPVLQIANHTVGLNDRSIGIELVNRGDGLEAFPEKQVSAIVELIKSLQDRFPSIPRTNIIRHSDFDQRTCMCGDEAYRRRQDPGAAFPFDKVMSEIRSDGVQTSPLALPEVLTGPAREQACAKID